MPEPAASQQQKAPKVAVTHLAELVARMSRFLTGLAVMPTFKTAQVGLAEWVALCALAEADGIGNKQLAKRLGVTGQRVNQVTTDLVDDGLISIAPSPEDARRVVLKLTKAGRHQLKAINRELAPLLAGALAGHEAALVEGLDSLRLLLKFVAMAQVNGQANHPPRHGHSAHGHKR